MGPQTLMYIGAHMKFLRNVLTEVMILTIPFEEMF